MRDDWVECTLGEVCHTTSGGTPSRKNKGFYNGSIPWVKSGELNYNIILKTEEHITEEAIKKSSAKIFPKGSILIALYGATIGKLAFLGVDAATNQAVCAIFKNKIFESNFLFNYLFHKRRKLIEQGTGGAQPNISQTILKKLTLPIAPLPEQRAIVAQIEELFSSLDNGISDLNKASAQLKIYRQAVLKKAFTGELSKEWRAKQTSLPTAHELLQQIQTERQNHQQQQLTKWQETVQLWQNGGKEGKKPAKPRALKELPVLTEEEAINFFNLPQKWKWVKLGELTAKLADGPFGSHLKTSDYVETGVQVIRLENIKNLYFDNSKQSFITKEKYKTISRHTVLAGDIIFSTFIANETKVAIVPSDIDFAINKADCLCIRPFKQISNKYIEYILSTRYSYSQLVNQIHGATRPRINTTQLKSLPIPICSLPEQRQIVQEIESRLSVCDNIEQTISASLAKAEGLRQSILKKGFAGELLSSTALEACRNEADWQPASELLKQIKAKVRE